MTQNRFVIAALCAGLLVTSTAAYLGLSRTPANAQTSAPGLPEMAPTVGTTGGTNGSNVVVAYPNGIIAVVTTNSSMYKPEGAKDFHGIGTIHTYRVNLAYGNPGHVENLENRRFDTLTGELLDPAGQPQPPKP